MASIKKMERKHFFINRKLQGRYMFTFLIPMLIMLLFMVATLYFAADSIVKTAASIVREDVQNIISLHMQDAETPSIDIYKVCINEINRYIRDFSENSKYRSVVTTSLLWVFGAGIFIVIIQIALLTIFYSHRIAGPLYRFEMVCHNIIEGKYTDIISLRKGDEMKNLARLLNDAIEKTRKRFGDLKESSGKEDQQKIFDYLQL